MSVVVNRKKQPRRKRLLRRIGQNIGRWVVLACRSVFQPRIRGFVICSTARSGSSYFCDLLASTGKLGIPGEYFNQSSRRWHDPDYPGDPRKQLDAVRTTGATPNGVYGVKMLASHFSLIGGKVDPMRELPSLKLVRLRRRDLLGQAISLARAEQTGQYGSGKPAVPPRAYDRDHIRACLRVLSKHEALWDRMIGELGVTPLELEYETMTQDPQLAVDRVASLMELRTATPISWDRVASLIQRDEISEEWRRRFLEETGDEFRHLAALATPPSPPSSASAP